MKYIKISIFALLVSLFGSCQLNEMMTYSEPTTVYFTSYDSEADSLAISFTMTKEQRYTAELEVSFLGNPITESGVIPVRVVADQTDATEGVHYEALSEVDVEAGALSATIPLELLYTPDMDDDTYTITLELYDGDDFGVAYTDRSKVRVQVTNQLIKPSYWDSFFVLYFGDYSQTKHADAIDLMGHDFPISENDIDDFNYYMLKGRALCLYYATNDVYDENGEKITTWPAF